jgi:hypothetical protein
MINDRRGIGGRRPVSPYAVGLSERPDMPMSESVLGRTVGLWNRAVCLDLLRATA